MTKLSITLTEDCGAESRHIRDMDCAVGTEEFWYGAHKAIKIVVRQAIRERMKTEYGGDPPDDSVRKAWSAAGV